MLLVSYKLDTHSSILQTKFSDREGHEARRVGLEAVPLDQHIEGGHGEGQARLKIGPAPMHHLFQTMVRQKANTQRGLEMVCWLPNTPWTRRGSSCHTAGRKTRSSHASNWLSRSGGAGRAAGR